MKNLTKLNLFVLVICSLFVLGLFVPVVAENNGEEFNIENNLVAYWQFDEGQGQITSDKINSTVGTLTGDSKWVLGKFKKGVDFNGASDRIEINTENNLNNLNSITISAWIFPRQGISENNWRILSKSESFPTRRFAMQVESSGSLSFIAGYNRKGGHWMTPTGSLSLDSWHHVLATYTYGNTSALPDLYIDGVKQGVISKSVPRGIPVADNNRLYFGDRGDSMRFFNGIVDEIKIYNRKVNDFEAQAIFNTVPPVVPTVVLTQSKEETTSDGAIGESFEVSWSSEDVTSCTLSKEDPNGNISPNWATGIFGSKTASPFKVGVHHWWINCIGEDNSTIRADIYHTVNYCVMEKPNIIVIMSDDQDDMGSMEFMNKTKSLLMDQGIVFENSFASDPQCCPSRAGFMTGQYPHNNGVYSNTPPDGGYFVFKSTENNSLPVWLKQAGYTTALMGKYLNGYGLSSGIPAGWDTWFGLIDTYKFYNFRVNDNGFIRSYGNSTADYQTDVLTQKAVNYITSNKDSSQPYFLWLTPVAPHVGYPGDLLFPEPALRHKGLFTNLVVPKSPSFNEEDISDKPSFVQLRPLLDAEGVDYTEKSYRVRMESLLGVDDMVESIVNTLRDSGELDNTIIVYTSDNGFFHGEHRKASGKRDVYEESIRVPLVVSGPGIPKGQTRDQLVNNLDLTATILNIANATPGRTIDGRSLTPLFTDMTFPWRTSLLIEATEPWTFTPATFGFYDAIRTQNYVYAEHKQELFPDTTERELYDMDVDPYQLVNKYNDSVYSGIKNSLQEKLSILKNCAGPTCWISSIDSSAPTFKTREIENTDSKQNLSSEAPTPSLISWKTVMNLDTDVEFEDYKLYQ